MAFWLQKRLAVRSVRQTRHSVTLTGFFPLPAEDTLRLGEAAPEPKWPKKSQTSALLGQKWPFLTRNGLKGLAVLLVWQLGCSIRLGGRSALHCEAIETVGTATPEPKGPKKG
jgi:hypothetical protein